MTKRIQQSGSSDRNQSTWSIRKKKHKVEYGLNYHFAETIDTLHFCTKDSIMSNTSTLIKYFIDAYDMSRDFAEMWTLYALTDDTEILEDHLQLDPFKITDVQTNDILFTSADNPSMKTKLTKNYKSVNIVIGQDAELEDVEWFIRHKWNDLKLHFDKDYKPRKQKRDKDVLLRDSMIYVLKKVRDKDKSAKDIQSHLDMFFPNKDDVDITTISSIHKKFEPRDDWFIQPIEVTSNLDEMAPTKPFELEYRTDPKPHFFLKKVDFNFLS